MSIRTACFVLLLGAAAPAIGLAQPPGTGGEERKILKQFDADESGWLDQQERKVARAFINANPLQRRGFGGPGGGPPGGRDGFGGPGGGPPPGFERDGRGGPDNRGGPEGRGDRGGFGPPNGRGPEGRGPDGPGGFGRARTWSRWSRWSRWQTRKPTRSNRRCEGRENILEAAGRRTLRSQRSANGVHRL